VSADAGHTLVHAPEPRAGPARDVAPAEAEREKLDVIGRISSSVVHDLKNPLATIVATTQSLLTFWALPGGPLHRSSGRTGQRALTAAHLKQLREDVELILGEAWRASDIVGNLLSFVRRQSTTLEAVSVVDVLRRAALLFGHDLEVQDVRLVVSTLPHVTPDGGPWVLGNDNQLLQVLANLITNAQQALVAHRGGGTITLGCSVSGDAVEVAVEDDGPGIPQDQRETVFQAFYTTKPPGQGTGLGLSISADIVAGHGGTLRVEDGAAGGARFVMQLPRLSEGAATAAAARAGALKPAAAPAVDHGQAPRVLLVDDETGLRRIVARYLRRFGFRVEEATTGLAAAAALMSGSYDAIISDMRMPGFSGKQLFELVQRERPELIPRFVLMSGDLMRQETRRFVEQTGCLSLEKPYELNDLVALLQRVCRPTTARAAAD